MYRLFMYAVNRAKSFLIESKLNVKYPRIIFQYILYLLKF